MTPSSRGTVLTGRGAGAGELMKMLSQEVINLRAAAVAILLSPGCQRLFMAVIGAAFVGIGILVDM